MRGLFYYLLLLLLLMPREKQATRACCSTLWAPPTHTARLVTCISVVIPRVLSLLGGRGEGERSDGELRQQCSEKSLLCGLTAFHIS
jgi:hypothetical protein